MEARDPWTDVDVAAQSALQEALVHDAAGRQVEAVARGRAALRMKPGLEAARDLLRTWGEVARLVGVGDAANRRRQWADAARAYADALSIDPALPHIWVQYGHALKEQGLLDAAEAAYRSAIGRMAEPDADIHLQIGHLLKLRGMLPEAREAYLSCLAVDPNNQYARREIAAMLGRQMARAAVEPSTGVRRFSDISITALAGANMRTEQVHGLTIFRATAPDPQLLLVPGEAGWPLLPGRYGLLFEVHDDHGFEGTPILYIDDGDGYSEAGAVRLQAMGRRLWFREFEAALPIRQLRFDPADNLVDLLILRLRLLRFEPAAEPDAALVEGLKHLTEAAEDPAAALHAALAAEWPQVLDPGFAGLSLTGDAQAQAASMVYARAWQQGFAVTEGEHAPDFGARAVLAPSSDPQALQVIAIYHPRMYRIAQNDAWRGLGYTEWTDVAKAMPQYLGHHQPRLPIELGYYDQANPAVMRRQAALAKLYGVHAFCFQHHWFSGLTLLGRPLEILLADPAIDIAFLLSWAHEPWTKDWERGGRDVLIRQDWHGEQNAQAFASMLPALQDARYLQLNGLPILLLERPSAIPECAIMVATWRQLAKAAGLPGLAVLAANSSGISDPAVLGLDGVVDMPPDSLHLAPITGQLTRLNASHSGQAYSYGQAVAAEVERLARPPRKGQLHFPGVMPGFDDEALRPGRGDSFSGTTTALFHRWIEAAALHLRAHFPPGQRLLFVNAWNGWGEGAHLEPDRRFGHANLAAVAEVVAAAALDATALRARAALYNAARPGRGAEAALCLHIFYADLIEEFGELIGRARGLIALDVIVSVPEAWPVAALDRLIAALRPRHVVVSANRGRDVAPFLASLREVVARDYPFGCKVHSKKSTHVAGGARWRLELLDGLLAPTALARLDEKFFAKPEVGIAGPASAWLPLLERKHFARNERRMAELAPLLGLEQQRMTGFFAGTMFWFRPAALTALTRLAEPETLFEPELGQVDGTAAHAMERFFAMLAEAAGYEVAQL